MVKAPLRAARPIQQIRFWSAELQNCLADDILAPDFLDLIIANKAAACSLSLTSPRSTAHGNKSMSREIAMGMNLAAAGLFAATLVIAPAAAQQSPAPPGPAEASRLEGGHFVTTPQAHQWRASKLIGLDVYGIDNEKIGDVSEILIDHEGNEVVVIGVGGFLGIAGREVAVPFKAVEWRYGEPPKTGERRSDQGQTTSSSTPADASARRTVDTTRRGYPDFAVLRTTKDDLKNAPEFKYPRD